VTEPVPRTVDVRVGSSTDALTPLSSAERSLAARVPQWVGLGAVVLAAVAADQLTKWIVSSQLALDESLHVLGPFSIHHVQNSGIAFGLFASATPLVTALTALAVGWMLLFFARSGARHPVLPVALGLLIGGSKATSSPPSSRWLFARASPSTSTPRASSRSAAAREPTSGREARNRSSRSPAASLGTRC